MNIDESIYSTYLTGIAQTQIQPANQQGSKAAETEKADTARDSYIPSVSESDIPIPTSTYNANGMMVDDFQPVTGVNTDQQAGGTTASEESAGAGAAGGGSGSEDDEEETTTKVVTVNGVTYLETTTTENGITTTTRTRMSESV